MHDPAGATGNAPGVRPISGQGVIVGVTAVRRRDFFPPHVPAAKTGPASLRLMVRVPRPSLPSGVLSCRFRPPSDPCLRFFIPALNPSMTVMDEGTAGGRGSWHTGQGDSSSGGAGPRSAGDPECRVRLGDNSAGAMRLRDPWPDATGSERFRAGSVDGSAGTHVHDPACERGKQRASGATARGRFSGRARRGRDAFPRHPGTRNEPPWQPRKTHRE